jgi:uncharacterized protein YcbK (DUF882 family)
MRYAPSPGRAGLSWLAALLLTIAPVYAEGAEIVHVVGKGQTLGRIAKRHHVTVEAIREANNLRPGERIHPGLELVIPEKGKEAEAAKKAAQLAAREGRDGKKGKEKERAKKGSAKAKEGDDKGDPSLPRGPKRKGFVHLMRGSDRLDVQLLTRRGKLAPNALAGLSKILRFYPTGATTPIDPRLAALLGQVSDHFGGRTIKVVSGFRPYTPAQYTPHSNHNLGRAMDFSIEGVPNTVVRDFCRTFRNAGVGYYPNSSFVHLDVRTGKAYWIDYSRPGEAPHYDTPGGQGSPDEAVGDVEPHAGAPDATPGSAGGDSGSNDTQ